MPKWICLKCGSEAWGWYPKHHKCSCGGKYKEVK